MIINHFYQRKIIKQKIKTDSLISIQKLVVLQP
ncbi:MAG: hypothetical protein PWP52_1961 [Bacteroidales bacterium]|nr:hypothetical protein [Bacteroidales bacterium]